MGSHRCQPAASAVAGKLSGSWSDLAAELARWSVEKRIPTLWWRDDDAAEGTTRLGRLLDLRNNLKVPLSLAVIPATADASLVDAMGYTADTAILQHGWSHRNYGRPGETKIELGAGRARWDVLAELARGRTRLVEMFEPVFLPVLVPPYNAIDPGLVPALGNIGFKGLSTWAPRERGSSTAGFVQSNVHIDLIDWNGTRAYVGDEIALGQAVSHLAARRLRRVDPDEPTGLNTHHLAHDEEAWRFIERFVTGTIAGGAHWVSGETAFGLPAAPDRSGRMLERARHSGAPCNICGGTLYEPGPHARKAYRGSAPPKCVGCGSLERHRAVRAIYSRLEAPLIDWRRALFFAPDPSLQASWFASFETSEYLGENSMDLQDIPRQEGQYDLVALNQTIEMVPDDRKAFAELARICSDKAVLQIVFLSDLTAPNSEHYREPVPPHNWLHLYGRDALKRFGAGRFGFRTLRVSEADPVSGFVQAAFFLFRSPEQLDQWKKCWIGRGVAVEEFE